MMSSSLGLLLNTLSITLNIYFVLLIIRVLLSWFPNFQSSQFMLILGQLTDPYLNLFRRVIPPLGGMDFSPILAFFILQAVTQAVQQLAIQSSGSFSAFY
ncbi:YggT family protein [Synechococcus elongatus IITB7]|uniref:YggT family protein n=1 Tax=Synechococcus elongatus TaxID=32046 RepID=UPI0030D534D1